MGVAYQLVVTLLLHCNVEYFKFPQLIDIIMDKDSLLEERFGLILYEA